MARARASAPRARRVGGVLDAVAGGESSGVHAAALCAFREAVERTVAEGFAARRASAATQSTQRLFSSRRRSRPARAFARAARRFWRTTPPRRRTAARRARRACVDAFPVSRADPEDEALEGVGSGASELRGCRNPGKRSDEKKNANAVSKPFALARDAARALALRFPAEARAAARRWPPRRRRRGTPALWSPRSRRWPRRRRGVSCAAPAARRSVSRRARTARRSRRRARAVAANERRAPSPPPRRYC